MKVQFVDTTLRDGAQSLWASAMRTGTMEAVMPHLDRAGFKAVEVPLGGIYFKKMVRDLKEDPWNMVRMIGKLMPHAMKTVMGASVATLEAPAPPSVTKLFVERLVAHGAMDRVQLTSNTRDRIKKAFRWQLPFFQQLGVQIAPALSYTISPRHTDEYYEQKARELLAFNPDVIYLKDQGGLLTPDRIRTLLPAILRGAGDVPVEVHTHCTTGLGEVVCLEALKLGVGTVHTAIPPLANGSSQPSVFSLLRNARLMGYDAQLDRSLVEEASARLMDIARQEHLPAGMPLEYDVGQYIHQVPGGVISNLKHQLAQLRLQDRLDEVLEEAVEVRKELGYPIMITPYSQFVVSQSAINVALGERYKVIIDEIISFAQGVYGEEDSGVAWMDQNLKDRILSLPRAKELRPPKVEDVPLEKVRAQMGAGGLSDEDFLLRFIMRGDQEIEAMRAAGPPRRYGAQTPLRTLLEQFDRSENTRSFYMEKDGMSLRMRKDGSARPLV